MQALKLISIFSYLLICVPNDNASFTFVLLFLVGISSFKISFMALFSNVQSRKYRICTIDSRVFAQSEFFKNKYIRIISYSILCVQLIYAFYNADYSVYKVKGSNIIFIVIMPLLFAISSFFVAFNKNIFGKKQ